MPTSTPPAPSPSLTQITASSLTPALLFLLLDTPLDLPYNSWPSILTTLLPHLYKAIALHSLYHSTATCARTRFKDWRRGCVFAADLLAASSGNVYVIAFSALLHVVVGLSISRPVAAARDDASEVQQVTRLSGVRDEELEKRSGQIARLVAVGRQLLERKGELYRSDDPEAAAAVNDMLRELEEVGEVYDQQIDYLQNAKAAAFNASRKIVELEAHVSELKGRVARADAALAEANEELAAARTAHAEEMAELEDRVRDAEAARDVAVEDLKGAPKSHEASTKELRAQAADAAEALESLQRENQEAKDALQAENGSLKIKNSNLVTEVHNIADKNRRLKEVIVMKEAEIEDKRGIAQKKTEAIKELQEQAKTSKDKQANARKEWQAEVERLKEGHREAIKDITDTAMEDKVLVKTQAARIAELEKAKADIFSKYAKALSDMEAMPKPPKIPVGTPSQPAALRKAQEDPYNILAQRNSSRNLHPGDSGSPVRPRRRNFAPLKYYFDSPASGGRSDGFPFSG